MHGGSVEARSDGPGAGSEFVVDLPLAAAATAPGEAGTAIDAIPPRRILVVDDNADAAETLGLLLERLGGTVAVAQGGPEALELFGEFQPDAVILDIGMPGMDGYEVARCIRATAPSSDVLLVALTGWGQDHDQTLARAAGFDHHMIKPPDLAQLREVLWQRWPVNRHRSAPTHSRVEPAVNAGSKPDSDAG